MCVPEQARMIRACLPYDERDGRHIWLHRAICGIASRYLHIQPPRAIL